MPDSPDDPLGSGSGSAERSLPADADAVDATPRPGPPRFGSNPFCASPAGGSPFNQHELYLYDPCDATPTAELDRQLRPPGPARWSPGGSSAGGPSFSKAGGAGVAGAGPIAEAGAEAGAAAGARQGRPRRKRHSVEPLKLSTTCKDSAQEAVNWEANASADSPWVCYSSFDQSGPWTVVPELHPSLTPKPTKQTHHRVSVGHQPSMPTTPASQRVKSPLATSTSTFASFSVGPDGSDQSPASSPSSSANPKQPPRSTSQTRPSQTRSSSNQGSPFLLHSHLDHSLNEAAQHKAAAVSAKKRGKAAAASTDSAIASSESETASDGGGMDTNEEEEEEADQNSLTRQLAETAVSVREMSKQLGRARVVSHVQSVMIITKARDNHLIKLTRELALFLMKTPRNGRDRGLVVYVDSQLRKSKRFDADGLENDEPELFKPLPRRYSRTSSAASLANSMVFDHSTKRMTPLTQLTEAIKRTGLGGSETPGAKKTEGDEGQLRYWTNEMCTKSPHLFDFVITLGGDGTVLYASWLFQHVVPPVIPFALGSLGFLTNFDFSTYAYTLNHAIDSGIRVNLRMRFTCTVYRAIESDASHNKRRAVRSGKTGEIFMNSLTEDGWEALESGGTKHRGGTEGERLGKKDREIKCFSTRPVESFEVLNDLVVDRGPSPYVSLLELFGDEHHMTTVQADGLTVSTPTGSTAYSLSAGGSLVHPEIPAILITPICPHTLSFRPMLLPDSMELRICVPYNSRSTAWASFDGRGRVELRQGDHIKVTASQYPFPTVCADKQSTDWFGSISRTLKWNERQRQKSFVILEENQKQRPKENDHAKQRENGRPKAFSTDNQPNGGLQHARQDYGDDEEATSTDEEDEIGDEEDDDDDEEEEKFDIDDLSTTPSSPVQRPADPDPKPPAMSRMPRPAFDAPHLRSVSSASSVDLRDDDESRFRDHPPHPPRLSTRHGADEGKAAGAAAKAAAEEHQRKIAASQARRRARGEEGDRDYLHEPQGNRTRGGKGGGAKRGSASGDGAGGKSRSPRPSVSLDEGNAKYSGGDRAFALLGNDSETSLSDADY